MTAPVDQLKILFTVDGDWADYTYGRLIAREKFIHYLREEIDFARRLLAGKLIHLVHVSPLAGEFFLDDAFIPLYRSIEAGGGSIGIHSHLDKPLTAYNLFAEHRELVGRAVTRLRARGLRPLAHRGGYFSYEHTMTKYLEELGIRLELSNVVNRKFVYNGRLVSDWSNSLNHVYRLDYNNFLAAGDSTVWEIPVGYGAGRHLYLENLSPAELPGLLADLANRQLPSRRAGLIASITHSQYFTPLRYGADIKPGDNNLMRSRLGYKMYTVYQRLAQTLPVTGRMAALKQYSWSALYYRRRFERLVSGLAGKAQFINADEALSYLDGAAG